MLGGYIIIYEKGLWMPSNVMTSQFYENQETRVWHTHTTHTHTRTHARKHTHTQRNKYRYRIESTHNWCDEFRFPKFQTLFLLISLNQTNFRKHYTPISTGFIFLSIFHSPSYVYLVRWWQKEFIVGFIFIQCYKFDFDIMLHSIFALSMLCLLNASHSLVATSSKE
jgi:hypothetical protein